MRTCAVVLATLALTGTARAEAERDLVYVEAFGKAGAYGVGYERALAPWLGLGFAGSFLTVRQQQLATAAPYLHLTAVRRGRHAGFVELGAVIVHSRIPSPVMDWDGATDTGGGGVAALGWERATRHLVLRGQVAVLAGEGGVAPWGGFAIGWKP
jgi:hypothetical protein